MPKWSIAVEPVLSTVQLPIWQVRIITRRPIATTFDARGDHAEEDTNRVSISRFPGTSKPKRARAGLAKPGNRF